MIMICNVPDEVVESVKMGTWCGSSVAEKMIANGIPLDKIRAEIEEPLKINQGLNTESAKAQAIALSWVLEVIDKYKG